MCGIAGILSPNPEHTGRQRLQAMADALAHRGPDGEGFWHNPSGIVGLAHRRLSILDLTDAAAQPMHYLMRYSIVYNGEIYNYKELRKQLENSGHEFLSTGDTEVVLAAYAQYGEDCLKQFEGMFSFAIWDEKEQTLFCARDRFGEKPFYYFRQGEEFYFASEMKALWALGIGKETNRNMMGRYLVLGHVQNPSDSSETFYENIYSLPPGTFIKYNASTQRWDIQEYFFLRKEVSVSIKQADAVSITNTLLQNSVARCLRSDVPIGSSLSGGLDSSTIAAYVQALHQNSFQTFSAVFPGFDRDESAHIKQITSNFSLPNYAITPTAEGLVNDFEKLCWHQEEPFTSSSIYAQYKVYEKARAENVPVLLDGQGADEIFGGYIKYVHWHLQSLVSKSKFGAASKELSLFRKYGHKVPWGIKNYVAAFLPAHTTMFLESREHKKLKNSLFLNEEFAAGFVTDTYGIEKPTVTKLNDILHFNMVQMGLQELLRYADRNSMAHGVEVRLPFLNTALVKFIFSLPASCKIKDGYTKSLLRKTMQGKLPDSIVWRKDKVGFETPQKKWMQDPLLKDYLHEAKKQLVAEKFLSEKSLQQSHKSVEIHQEGNEAWRFICAAKVIKK